MNPADYAKLTAEARGVLASADAEATRLAHQDVCAAHVLLGLCTHESGRVAEVLQAAGIVSVQRARDALATLALPHSTSTAHGIAPELLRALGAAAEDQASVSPSELCVALLTAENTATELLGVLDVDRAAVMARMRVADATVNLREQTGSLEDHVRRAVERAERLATRVGRPADDGDVAVALLDEPDSAAARALALLGITRELLEEALADTRPRH
jgi:ATP-dependent Clp protease ATP-binding subunit ClpA